MMNFIFQFDSCVGLTLKDFGFQVFPKEIITKGIDLVNQPDFTAYLDDVPCLIYLNESQMHNVHHFMP